MTSVMTDYIHVSDCGEVSFIPGEMTDNRTTELLPCPFCGGEAKMRCYPYCTIIRCENDDCAVKPSCSSEHENADHSDDGELIEAWNSRADDFWPIAEITTDHIDLKHGRVEQRWIPERTCKWEYPQGVTGWLGYTVCSSCGERFDECVTNVAHYCPNCGCKVVGE